METKCKDCGEIIRWTSHNADQCLTCWEEKEKENKMKINDKHILSI